MNGTPAVFVALLLCLAPIGGVIVASDSPAQPQESPEDPEQSMTVHTVSNSSGYLAAPLDRIDRTEEGTASIDVAGSVEADGRELEAAYIRETLERRYAAAETTEEREAVVEEGAERLSRQVDELVTEDATAIQRYNDGAINTRELLRTLTIVNRESHETAAALEWVASVADDQDMDATAERMATEQVRLVPMQGPVREALAASMAGGTPLRTHVETSGDGVVLAAVDRTDQTYIREAHDPTAKAIDISDRYGGNPSPALDRFTELYPWSINSFGAIDAMGPEQVRLYRFGASHPHGELETYLDSGSTDILFERQQINPASVPSDVVQRTDGDLRLVVNTTWGGGPIGISAVDPENGEPVDATVELNGDAIGSTDEAQLWAVAPRGSATINATRAGETVTLETQLD